MYQVSHRALFVVLCPSRFLLSVRVLIFLILKGYENLHVHFEDCAGRRVTNASGADVFTSGTAATEDLIGVSGEMCLLKFMSHIIYLYLYEYSYQAVAFVSA